MRVNAIAEETAYIVLRMLKRRISEHRMNIKNKSVSSIRIYGGREWNVMCTTSTE